MIFAENLQLEINSNNYSISLKNNIAFSHSGIFLFPDFIVYGPSNSTIKLNFIVYFIMPNNKIIHFHSLKQLFFKPCQIGSILKVDDSCLMCPFGTYSFTDPNTTPLHLQKCHVCPEGALCLGENLIFPKAGYWIPLFNSSYIANCITTEACQGSQNFFELNKNLDYKTIFKNLEQKLKNFCAEGHYGILCYNCKEGYGKKSGNTCTNCQKGMNSFTFFKFVFIIIIICLAFAKFIYQNIFTDNKDLETNFGGFIKIFINHLQAVDISFSTLLSFFVQSNSKNIKTFKNLEIFFEIISIDFLYNQCNFPRISIVFKNYVFAKLLFIYVSPILFSLLAVLLTILSIFMILFYKTIKTKRCFKIKQIEGICELSYKIFQYFIVILIYFLYPTIIKNSFQVLNCFKLSPDIPETYLSIDPNIICWTSKHYSIIFILCIPGIIIFAGIYPIYLYRSLKMFKKEIEKTEKLPKTTLNENNTKLYSSFRNFKNQTFSIQNCFFFFSNGYKKRFFYWECLIFLKKLLIMLFISTNIINDEIRNVLFIFVLVIETKLTLEKKPYETKSLNRSVIFSNFVLTFSMLSILIYEKENKELIQFLFMIVMAILNGVFCVFMIYFIVKFGIINVKIVVNEQRKSIQKFLASMTSPKKLKLVFDGKKKKVTTVKSK